MKLAMLIIKVLLLGALFIVSNENLALSERDNMQEFTGLYYDWITSLFDQGRTVTGYVVEVDWLPKESDPSYKRSLEKGQG